MQRAQIVPHNEIVFPPNTDSWLRSQFLTFQRWIYESSHLVFFVKNLLESNTNIRVAAAGKKEAGGKQDKKVYISQRLIDYAKEEVEGYGAEFAVLLIPNYKEVNNQQLGLLQRLIEYCEQENIPHIDLYPHLQLKDFFPYDGHFNPEGHQVVADVIEDFLLGEKEDRQQGQQTE